MTYHKRDPLAGGFLVILQVAKLGPVSKAAGMDCEYPLDPNQASHRRKADIRNPLYKSGGVKWRFYQ